MITKFSLKARLIERRRELDALDRAYVNFVIGDEEYDKKRPILVGKIEELEDILCLTVKN